MTAFSDVMDALHDAEMGARLFDGDRLREAAGRLSTLAASYPPKTCEDCGHDAYWHDDLRLWFHRADAAERGPCVYGDGPVVLDRD